jgi:ATP-dependent DNA ligase
MSTFPTLFGESLHGKRKMWSVAVEDRDGCGVIITTHGYEDGKKVVNERVVSVGKNLGKKNATTPVTQAVSEAQALWNKKRDAGYSAEGLASPAAPTPVAAGGAGATATASDSETEEAATASAAATDTILPMLAHDFNKRGKSIKFPCFAQRKLDGVRCVAIAGKGLFSRNGKPASAHLTHIRKEVDALPAGTMLDGELYSDELTFQEIVGLVKKNTLRGTDAEKMGKIHLCVYDCVREGTNAARQEWLSTLFTSNSFASLRLLPTAECATVDDVKRLHADYVAEGYEGLILRNRDGQYKIGHRSTDLQKYKEFMDEEFTIVGFKEGDGVEKGCVIWRCTTKAGAEFDCRPRGTHEERAALFANGAAHVGKQLSIRFQEWTTDAKPRFPVGIAIRDYE